MQFDALDKGRRESFPENMLRAGCGGRRDLLSSGNDSRVELSNEHATARVSGNAGVAACPGITGDFGGNAPVPNGFAYFAHFGTLRYSADLDLFTTSTIVM